MGVSGYLPSFLLGSTGHSGLASSSVICLQLCLQNNKFRSKSAKSSLLFLKNPSLGETLTERVAQNKSFAAPFCPKLNQDQKLAPLPLTVMK